MKWMTRDGRVMDIKDMDNDHLANTAALIARQIDTLSSVYNSDEALKIKEKQLKKINKELRFRRKLEEMRG